MCVINNTLIILLTSPHFAPFSWWDLHFGAISIQRAEALGGNASTCFVFILLFRSWDLYLSYKYKVLCCVLCVYVMCPYGWTYYSIHLSVRWRQHHAWGGYALVPITIVKVTFCNGVIHDSDCEAAVLKGIFNLPQLPVGHVLCTRCCVEPSDQTRNQRAMVLRPNPAYRSVLRRVLCKCSSTLCLSLSTAACMPTQLS